MANIRKELRKIKNLDHSQKRTIILELIKDAKAKQLSLIKKHLNDNETLITEFTDKANSFLSSDNKRERSNAIWAIEDIKNKKVDEMLISCLNDSDKNIMRFSIIQCGKRELKEAVDLIIPKLNHESKFVKLNAIDALVSISDKKAFDPITKKLYDYDDHVKGNAAKALGGFGDKELIKKLIDAYRVDEINTSNIEIVKAIIALGPEEHLETLNEWRKTTGFSSERNAIKNMFGTIKDPIIIPYLRTCLHGTDKSWEETIVMLSNTGCIEAAPAILDGTIFADFPQSWISDGSVNRINLAGANALLKLPQAEVLPILLMHIEHYRKNKFRLHTSLLYSYCEPFIKNITDQKAKPLLETLVDYDKKSIRKAALYALENMK